MILLLLFFVSTFSFDCDLITDYDVYTFEDLAGCLTTVAFSSKITTETIDAVENYVYGDINKNSPPPYSISVDMEAELEVIRTKQDYNNDYEMHADIMASFKKLRDSHTVYIPPICYSGIQFTLPFSSTSKMSPNGTQLIYVAKQPNKVVDDYGQIFEGKQDYTTKWLGWRIEKINNVFAMDFMREFIKDNGTSYSRDDSVRFNDALGAFFDVSIMRMRMPGVNRVNFDLYDETTGESINVDVGFIGSSQLDISEHVKEGGFLFTCGYKNSENGGVSSILDETTRHVLWDDILGENMQNANIHLIQRRMAKRKEKKLLESRGHDFSIDYRENQLDGFTTILDDDDNGIAGFYRTSGEPPLGVMQIKGFMPVNIQMYWKQIKEILEKFKTQNIDKIVLDVRGNGGGIVCLSTYLQQLISPYAPKAINPMGDMKTSTYWKSLYCPANIPKFQYLTTARKPVHTNTFISGPTYERGGISHQYSQMIGFDCDMLMMMEIGYSAKKSPKQFEPENIVILTDGKCGSACGMFVSTFRQLKLAKIITQGGIVDEPMALSSFKAASVQNNRDNFPDNVCVSKTCNCQDEPKVFPGRSIQTFSWYEVYPYDEISINELGKTDTTTPMGFKRFPEDARMHDWTFDFNEVAPILLAEKYFDTCFDWEVKREDEKCPPQFSHSLYGYACKDGDWDPSECVLKGCNAGYYLAEDKTHCKKMPAEYDMWGDYLAYFARYIFLTFVLPVILIVCIPCLVCCLLCCVLCGIGCFCIARKKKAEKKDPVMTQPAKPVQTASEKTSLLVGQADVKSDTAPNEVEI